MTFLEMALLPQCKTTGDGQRRHGSRSGCALHNSRGHHTHGLHLHNQSLAPDAVPNPGYPFSLPVPFLHSLWSQLPEDQSMLMILRLISEE